MKVTPVRCCDLLKLIQKQIYESGRFERILEQVTIIYADNGKCKAMFTVAKEHQNAQGSLHGGYSAALVDLITTYALMSIGKKKAGVSVDLNMKYFRPAMFGDKIVVDAKTIKLGKRLAHLSATLKNKKTGKLVVSGIHTKFIG